eukprot:6229425-Pyramimonas_sp.AAC.1
MADGGGSWWAQRVALKRGQWPHLLSWMAQGPLPCRQEAPTPWPSGQPRRPCPAEARKEFLGGEE